MMAAGRVNDEHDGHRLIRKCVRTIVRMLVLLAFQVSFEGLNNIPSDGSFILVSNHTSMADVAAIHTKFDRWLYWVAKKELFQTPVIKYLIPKMGAIPVDRERVDLTAARGIFSVLNSGRPVAMFPQGTRVRPEQVNSVMPKTGIAHFAVKTSSQILPVAISGRFKLFGKIRIVVGEPFRLDADSKKKYQHEELLELSILVMKRVYDLIGFEYNPGKGDV